MLWQSTERIWRRGFTAAGLRATFFYCGDGRLSFREGKLRRRASDVAGGACFIEYERCQQVHVGGRPNAIAVETRPSTTNPMGSFPGFGEDPRSYGTKECVFFRQKHNAHMTQPDSQVSGLRCFYPFKIANTAIKNVRILVGVDQPRARIEQMHQ